MSPTDYGSVVALRNEVDPVRRGNLFEQAMREILPWSHRPPLAVIAPSEQLDAFFEWNSWSFLVEAKAKEQPITAGSHDWEDFDLKVRKRHKGCIGLFCSLYPVSKSVIRAAESLNREGYCTIVLQGRIWDDLHLDHFPLDELLRYMILHARANFLPIPPKVPKVRQWCFDLNSTVSHIHSNCRRYSAAFLRRSLHPKDSQIYVPREIDRYIGAMASNLTPTRLCIGNARTRVHDDTTYCVTRDAPIQLCVFRDSAGSGKTTFAAHTCSTDQDCFCIVTAASAPDIDKLDEFLASLGSDYGLQQLISSDMPLVAIVDSLDEAQDIPDKPSQIASLIKLLDKELNPLARKIGLTAFPLGIVFTGREDYWDFWQTFFEGRQVRSFRSEFAHFSEKEFHEAVEKYAEAYGYRIVGRMPPETVRVLSNPFNLGIFSEANEFQGHVPAVRLLDDDVLDLFFTRKQENILKRHIPVLTRESFMHVCEAIAVRFVEGGLHTLDREEIVRTIIKAFPVLSGDADSTASAIQSELILVADPTNPSAVSFKHLRFIEYLVAHKIATLMRQSRSNAGVGRLLDNVLRWRSISILAVHNALRSICAKRFPLLQKRVEDYFGNSVRYVRVRLQQLRQDVAYGRSTPQGEIAFLVEHVDDGVPENTWDTFYIVAARNNDRRDSEVAAAFAHAWATNAGRGDRWKLIEKMVYIGESGLECVVDSVSESVSPKEWEVFLGCVLAEEKGGKVREKVRGGHGSQMVSVVSRYDDKEWKHVKGLLKILMEDRDYVPGQPFDGMQRVGRGKE